MMNQVPKESAKRAWISIALGFSIFPLLALAILIASVNPKDYRHFFYTSFTFAVLAIVLQLAGLILGIVGVIKGPRRGLSALGVLVCLFFGAIAIHNLFG